MKFDKRQFFSAARIKKEYQAWGCLVLNGVYHGDILYVIKLWGIILMFSLRHKNSIAHIFWFLQHPTKKSLF